MTRIDELNESIAILSEECFKHDSCSDCPLYDNEPKHTTFCLLENSPDNWKKLEERLR